jgi:hypothetical protein
MFLPKLNHALVCLIPKVNEEENTFIKYRPIHSLVNSSKIISKILTKGLLAKVIDRIRRSFPV